MHKAGFVNIVGKPNAGKSTLLNQLMGEKLAIVTQKHKPLDTEFSGFITKKMYKLYFLIRQEF
jgi:GTP-binding protein Era